MELAAAVVGIGDWARQEYLPGLKEFFSSQFLKQSDVELIVVHVDDNPPLGAIGSIYGVPIPQANLPGPFLTPEGHTIYVVKSVNGKWRPPFDPPVVDVVFVVTPLECHIDSVTDAVQFDPIYVIVEKPFFATAAYQRTAPNAPASCYLAPQAPQWRQWHGTVFAFDHYLTRLWYLIHYQSPRLGRIERLILRMREEWAAENPRTRYGAVLDMGVHAVPLFLLFARAPRTFTYSEVYPCPKPPAPEYFQFEQPGWRLRGPLSRLLLRTCIADVGIGWYDHIPLPREELYPRRVPDKFFCVECERGRIWADLAPPYLIFTEKRLPGAGSHWAKTYPKCSNSMRVRAFSAPKPVHLMINAVLMQAIEHKQSTDLGKSAERKAEAPITVVPTCGSEAVTAKKIMRVLEKWDHYYRS